MSYICLHCCEIYKMNLPYCPKISCNGEVAEIDDLMTSTIAILNLKGYRTEFCCSGHSYEGRCYPYIKFNFPFSQDEFKEKFKELPSPWYIDDGYWIGCEVNEESVIEAQKTICDVNLKLLEFVDAMPSLYED